MSKWSEVGEWIKENAGSGAALVGSLLTGNVPGAIAAGVSLVGGATGTDNPVKVLEQLTTNPDAMVKLKELYYKDEDSVRKHIETMQLAELKDKQEEHEQAQLTIRNGDNAQGGVKWVRPLHASLSLVCAMFYAFTQTPDTYILGLLLALPFSYGGLRTIDKIKAFGSTKNK